MDYLRWLMCAFLRPEKGVILLNNKTFRSIPADDKRRYLAAVLKNSTGGALDDGMIGRIMPNVSIHNQYRVSVYTNERSFWDAVYDAFTGKNLLSVVFAPNKQAPAAAIISPEKAIEPGRGRRAIFICALDPYVRKGAG